MQSASWQQLNNIRMICDWHDCWFEFFCICFYLEWRQNENGPVSSRSLLMRGIRGERSDWLELTKKLLHISTLNNWGEHRHISKWTGTLGAHTSTEALSHHFKQSACPVPSQLFMNSSFCKILLRNRQTDSKEYTSSFEATTHPTWRWMVLQQQRPHQAPLLSANSRTVTQTHQHWTVED